MVIPPELTAQRERSDDSVWITGFREITDILVVFLNKILLLHSPQGTWDVICSNTTWPDLVTIYETTLLGSAKAIDHVNTLSGSSG